MQRLSFEEQLAQRRKIQAEKFNAQQPAVDITNISHTDTTSQVDTNIPYLENIPEEIQHHIMDFIRDRNDQLNLASVNNATRPGLLLHLLTSNINLAGKRKAAKALIEQHPEYLLARSDITDFASRHFKNITAFEYALWALDFDLCEMMIGCLLKSTLEAAHGSGWYQSIIAHHASIEMIACLPLNRKVTEMLGELLSQYENVQNHGVTYILDETVYKETCYQINFLIDVINTFGLGSEEVENMQLLLPVNIANFYCQAQSEFHGNPEDFCNHLFDKNTSRLNANRLSLRAILRAAYPATLTPEKDDLTTLEFISAPECNKKRFWYDLCDRDNYKHDEAYSRQFRTILYQSGPYQTLHQDSRILTLLKERKTRDLVNSKIVNLIF